MTQRPILYSFRRCPYAMRARLALAVAGQTVELREIVLRDKVQEFVAAFPNATVPGLILPDGSTHAESLDIMHWALDQHDPDGWRDAPVDETAALIAEADTSFKTALDHYKYASRHPEIDAMAERDTGLAFLSRLDAQLQGQDHLFGAAPRLADFAILPFVRQFAYVDIDWFTAQPIPNVIAWLDRFLASPAFAAIMSKYARWTAGDAPVLFPDP